MRRRVYGRGMKLTVRFDDERFSGVARDLELADQALRQSFSGFDVDAVEREVRAALAEIDHELSDEEITAYARSISERQDHELVLG